VSIARFLNRLTSATVVATFTLAAAVSAVPTPVAAAEGLSFVSVANDYRASSGKAPVALHALIDQIAVERGQQLAAAGELGHDFDYLKARFADLGICWRGFGEIVARNGTGDVAAFGGQWWNSSPHRTVMLGDYTHAGGSRESDGQYWYGVMIFVKLCEGSTEPGGFSDIGSSPFRSEIQWLVNEKIAAGCSATRYCPTTAVTRAQMASFLKRAMNLPATSRDFFWDDDGSMHEADINRLTASGVSGGCGEGRYCPGATVNRAQMASFLARALGLPATSHDYFWDDDGSMHEDSINRLAAAGVVGGCATGRYCPGGSVTREQMAAFIERAFR
jgi:uncharacterized protein YkwD